MKNQKQKSVHPNEKLGTTDKMAGLPGKNAINGQKYMKNPSSTRENPVTSVPKPEVTNKTMPSKTDVRGAGKVAPVDRDRKNRGAVKPWKPLGRK